MKQCSTVFIFDWEMDRTSLFWGYRGLATEPFTRYIYVLNIPCSEPHRPTDANYMHAAYIILKQSGMFQGLFVCIFCCIRSSRHSLEE